MLLTSRKYNTMHFSRFNQMKAIANILIVRFLYTVHTYTHVHKANIDTMSHSTGR